MTFTNFASNPNLSAALQTKYGLGGSGNGAILATATLLGSAGFVNLAGFTVYVLSNDTTSSLACTVGSGCTAVWPPVAPPNGIALSTGFTAFARSDNGAMQLAYNGHPAGPGRSRAPRMPWRLG